MSHQPDDFAAKWKRNFNITYNLCLIHQRGIVVLMRDRWGKRALGTSSFFALVLMLLWAAATQDPLMYVWIVLWFFVYVKRRLQSIRLAKQGMHTEYDGRPKEGQRLGFSERISKLLIEPTLVGIFGWMVLWLYQQQGWRLSGLPYFLLSGVFSLTFCELVKQQIWNRRLESMNDARIEQSAAMNEFQDRYGNF